MTRRVVGRAFLGIAALAGLAGVAGSIRTLNQEWEEIGGKPQSVIRRTQEQFNRLTATLKAGVTRLALPAIETLNRWMGKAADTLEQRLDPATAKLQKQFEALRRLRLERELATRIPMEGITQQPGGGLGPQDLLFQARITRANIERVSSALIRGRETPSEGISAEPAGGIF
jgi:hypothetical protein